MNTMMDYRERRRLRTSFDALMSWALYDWANSAFQAIIQTFVFAAYFTRQVAENPVIGSMQWGNTIGAAGIVAALGGPVLGAIADQSGRRKPWVAFFTILCAGATAFLWFVRPTPSHAELGLLLVGLGIIGSEFATIFYNAMLPSLVPQSDLGRWSGWGWSLGYGGGLACLVIAVLAFVGEDPWIILNRQSAEHLRAAFLLTAVWYLLFAIPLFLRTPDSPSTGKALGQAAGEGLRQLQDSLRHVRRYAPIARFLIARMLYIDGLVTVFAFGGVYAAGTFDMTEEEVLTFGIALNITAGLGAFGFAWIDDWIGGKWTILLSLIGLITLSTIILVVTSQTAFWIVGLLLGIFVGPVQAASRSFMARIAPEALQNQMFGFFAFSGKATAFLGPLMVGWITHWTGSQRLGMGMVVGLLLLGFILMLTVVNDKKYKVHLT